ncbi:MAG: phosphotransferase [Steroidobacteraceae bacterium]
MASVVPTLPQDPMLPQLAALFDHAGLAARLDAHFLQLAPGAALRVLACEIERVKFRPGRNCVVGYCLRVQAGGRRRMQRLTLCMYTAEEARERYARHARAQRSEAAPFLPAVSLLAGIDALCWLFPHDRKVTSLPALTDQGLMRNVLMPQVVQARWGDVWQLHKQRSNIVSYFPEHGCTVRVRCYLRHRSLPRQRVWTVYGHMCHDDTGARTFATMQRLEAGREQRPSQVGFARPVLYDASLRLLWQEGVDAPTLDAALRAAPHDRALWRRVVCAAAYLHGQDCPSPRQVDDALLCAEFEQVQAAARRALPSAAERIDALVQRLLASMPPAPARAATLHGDLHSKNILVGENSVTLIDLDRVSRGNALAESGGLLAEIAYRDCVARRPVAWRLLFELARVHRDILRDGVPLSAYAWHTAAALVRERAYRSLTSLKPGRLVALDALLDTATALLDFATRQRGFAAPLCPTSLREAG